jgi:hypothetical protein
MAETVSLIAIFEVLTELLMRIQVFWNVMTFSLMIRDFSKEPGAFETSGTTHPPTQRHSSRFLVLALC